MRLCSKSASRNRMLISIAAVFFKRAAVIIAVLDQKTLHWQLSKVILSGMYNCNFEAISKVLNKRMKKLEMEYGPLITQASSIVMFWIRFWKELVILQLH